jgi:hypothetical protein
MNNKHLTDDQIQEILDARMFQSGPILPMHLGTCASCQKRLESFRQLYAGLGTDPGFALPPAFADSVLDKLAASRSLFWKRPAVKIILTISACAAAMTGLIIFVNMRPLANGALQVFATLKMSFLPLGGQIKQFFSWMGGNAKPFLYGGFGLLSAYIVERILLRQNMRHSH